MFVELFDYLLHHSGWTIIGTKKEVKSLSTRGAVGEMSSIGWYGLLEAEEGGGGAAASELRDVWVYHLSSPPLAHLSDLPHYQSRASSNFLCVVRLYQITINIAVSTWTSVKGAYSHRCDLTSRREGEKERKKKRERSFKFALKAFRCEMKNLLLNIK